MKTEDPLLSRVGGDVAPARDAPAIFDAQRQVLCRFGEVEELSQRYENGLSRTSRTGEIVAIQIGNHPHWPALLLACLRREIVVLPLERTVSDRDAPPP